MEIGPQFSQILLLMTSICVVQATFIQTVYGKLDPGENITGNTGAELTTRSKIECSDRLVMYKTLLPV